MERLTFEGNFCEIAKCAEIPGGSFCENGACSQKEVWERLKAYEDTGLSPEDAMILSALVQCGGCVHSRPLNRADPNEDIYVDGCLWCRFHQRGVFPEEFCSDGILSEEKEALIMEDEGRCSWMDSETGVCDNEDCPMYCGCCPVPDDPGVCGYDDRSGNQPQRD